MQFDGNVSKLMKNYYVKTMFVERIREHNEPV